MEVAEAVKAVEAGEAVEAGIADYSYSFRATRT